MKIKNYIPNFITSLNMLSGFIAIILTSQNNYKLAIIFILLAALFDVLDGLFARFLDSTSKIGVQLDSLSDLVSFGVAPAYLLYNIKLYELGYVGAIISGFFMLMGGFRLARFNVQLVGFNKEYFNGIPIPTGAILLLSFVYNFYIIDSYDNNFIFLNNYLIVLYTLFVSLMMVSNFKYPTIAVLLKNSRIPTFLSILFGIIFAVLFIITTGKFVFYVFVLYLIYGLIFSLVNGKENV
ncbi:MAG TPA: CDP-diacylglycerol--serine O-phosphatidyltransferase [Ignavibacteriales bacterium]|nr:CDP-diacylglycerol--serine O-phosphatidyltransferase [Ignavibacteriales bacterium]HOL81013.1 CDP-diacylglycerol--serine O-phosphatidyltransferase [Ignavibacteriales bacterium]HOM64749.1 CDP-diacylglycerol--serine O-phosphatidyltransferase [Ignavibacteriales bacterium]HPD66719.1 CDP-diacylglycerol--serine O-phosphatidyltransferase [Ignavibacteriales bacterium]HPP32793.1 CDP-diacylglycerol--serine O-phosphatidyltransferase [Ignavibacteriales bacterium]